ncbi:hypothetical protein V6N11_067860 [Hibiscus sabdariffa]|uniref:Uncharacterized protein n=1 Tax=Hibiscus sabdariffa TaxID=183260 RepID=A0ABR2SS25_9ROSI
MESLDVVVWDDEELGWIALDSLHDGSEWWKLTDFVRITNYRIEHKYGIFSCIDAYTIADIVNEAVNKYCLIFVTSVGNRELALSTVGTPGGTLSIIVIGAYVSSAVVVGAYSVVESIDHHFKW